MTTIYRKELAKKLQYANFKEPLPFLSLYLDVKKKVGNTVQSNTYEGQLSGMQIEDLHNYYRILDLYLTKHNLQFKNVRLLHYALLNFVNHGSHSEEMTPLELLFVRQFIHQMLERIQGMAEFQQYAVHAQTKRSE